MANAINFLTRTPSLRSCAFKTTRAIPSSLPSPQLKLRAIKKESAKQSIFINRKIPRLKPYHVVAALDASDDATFEDTSSHLPVEDSHDHDEASNLPLEGHIHIPDDRKSMLKTITEFYEYVNGKNVDQLAKLLSEHCCFDDYSFPEKFEGKEEVYNFFVKLTKSMGENVKFKIEEICEGDGLVACAIWHIEWKEDRIPFTRGCTFFRFLTEGDKLLIREAHVLIESPVKPGGVVVGLLDLVRSVFDDFPTFTKWFLQSPHALLQILVNVYNIVAAPFINPLLMFYTHMWMLIYKWFSCMIGLFRYITKLLK